jgi:hypothetical protein
MSKPIIEPPEWIKEAAQKIVYGHEFMNVPAVIAIIEAEYAKVEAGWLDIESAPKNQKLIVGYFNRSGKWRSVMASYYAEGTLGSETSDSGWAEEGWYEECESQETIWPIEQEPTYWRPLHVAPPKES